jgi:hypothetical protein
VKRLLPSLALLGCTATPLPAELERAQAREVQHDDAGALLAYRALVASCAQGSSPSRRECALAATREAQLDERLGRSRDAYQAWLRVPALCSNGEQRLAARALARAAELADEDLGDAAAAETLAWRAVEGFPDEVPSDDALKLAVRLGRARDPRRLAARLEAAWARFAHFDIGDNLLFERAELSRTVLDDAAGAVALYDRLADSYRRSGLRDDSLWRAAALLRARGDARGALGRLQRILDTRKDALVTGSYNSVYLDDAQLLVGRIWLEDLRDPERAADAFTTLADDYPESTLRDDALYELARARLARHTPPSESDRAAACAALERLARQFPDGNRVSAGRALASELACR